MPSVNWQHGADWRQHDISVNDLWPSLEFISPPLLVNMVQVCLQTVSYLLWPVTLYYLFAKVLWIEMWKISEKCLNACQAKTMHRRGEEGKMVSKLTILGIVLFLCITMRPAEGGNWTTWWDGLNLMYCKPLWLKSNVVLPVTKLQKQAEITLRGGELN